MPHCYIHYYKWQQSFIMQSIAKIDQEKRFLNSLRVVVLIMSFSSSSTFFFSPSAVLRCLKENACFSCSLSVFHFELIFLPSLSSFIFSGPPPDLSSSFHPNQMCAEPHTFAHSTTHMLAHSQTLTHVLPLTCMQ